MPDVNQLEDTITENNSQINSPQGVNSTVFMSMSSASIGTSYQSNSYTFGDGLFVVNDQGTYHTGARMFGGSQICSTNCYDQALYIVNYSSNTLVGIIGVEDKISTQRDPMLFDTYGNTLHVIPKWVTSNSNIDLTLKVEWPIGSTIRNYTGGNIIFDSAGNKVNNNSMIYNSYNGSGAPFEWIGGGYWGNPSLAGSSTPSYYCQPNSITAYSENSSIITRICQLSGGTYGSNYTYNLTNSSTLPQVVMNSTNGGQQILLLIEKYTGSTIDWTNAKVFLHSNFQYKACTYNAGSSDYEMVGTYSHNQGTFVATYSIMGIMSSNACNGIAELNRSSRIEFGYSEWTTSSVLTFVLNSSQGAPLWMSKTGIRTNSYQQTVAHGDHVYLCGPSTGFVNGTSLNMGSGGVIKLKKSSGEYVNHIASSGGGNQYSGCTSMFSDGTQIFLSLFKSVLTGNQLSYSTSQFSVVRMDNNSNLNLVYTINGALTGIFENTSRRVIIIEDPNSISYGSGTMAGGDGFGALLLEDDYDQDNQADNTDSDDDNDGYLDVNDNCPRGMIGWTPGSSTDADSDGCHFSEDLDNDNDGIDDSLDNCDSPANSFTSTPITDYDEDGCRDSTEDDDDDNDNILDVNDNCIKSVNNSDVLTNDTDSDGCGDSVEDYDDDNDGVFDMNDQCQTYPNTWQSSSNTDHDSDGCKDSLEDNDDDNDGINDNLDSCSTGKIGWIPTTENDGDSDGCYDANEDIDDDNDGVTDSADACPKQAGDSSFGSLLGCPDTDQDGYGDNIDSCESEYGTSFRDVYGCPDSDGDGYSNSGDDFPDDATAHSDSDSDGVEDSIDEFPFLPGQWLDGDGDGYGDNPTGPTPDSCVETYGNSTRDIYGCLDSDGDGYSDINDKFPNDKSKWLDTDNDGVEDSDDAFPLDPSQQTDSDGDGAGDNPTGVGADKFPNDSTQWSDIDGDSYGDNPNGTNPDAFITDPTQWSDADGDGYGDNPSGRLYDMFPENPTQWEDADGDSLGDNQNGTDADPSLNDFDNDGYNDSIDILPKLASPGDLDADGCLDVDDIFPTNPQECFDNDGDGEGDNADVDDDNDGWADTDEERLGTDPLNSAQVPVESFEIVIPGTTVGLGAWDLIGIFGGVPLFAWIGFGFVTRNSRCAKYEVMLRDAKTRDELEQVAHMWEYSLMLRMLGPHQGIRLERLRADLDEKFEAMDQRLSSIENHEFDQTQMVVEEMNDTEKQVPEITSESDYPSIGDAAQNFDENGYEWFTAQDGTNFYRTIGSQSEWTKLEN